MTESNQASSKPEGFLQGPMTGGTTVHLGEYCAVDGGQYSMWLQFGGEVRPSAAGASKVDDVWIKHPQRPPSKAPVIVIMPVGGGPRASYEAAVIVDLARRGASLVIACLWGGSDLIELPPKVVEQMGAAIEGGLLPAAGYFRTQWIAEDSDPDGVPF